MREPKDVKLGRSTLLARLSRLTIRGKLLLFSISLLLISTSVIAYSGYTSAKTETDKLIRTNLANNVELMVQSIKQTNVMVENGNILMEQAQEQMKTFMLGAKQADGQRPINKDIDLGENGYFYVLDAQGNLLAHPSREGDNLWEERSSSGEHYIQHVIERAQDGGGFTFYDFALPNSDKEAMKITYSLPVSEWEWIVVAGSYYQDYNTGQTQILRTTLIALLICIVLGTAGATLFANHIARPIGKIAEQTRKVAAGDLTSEPLSVVNRDEIGKLAADFNAMCRDLVGLIRQVMYNSGQVALASRTLETSIEETNEAARHIAENTQLIVTDIESQAMSTEQSAKAMEEMATGIQRIADVSSEAYDTSVRSESEAKQGHDLMGLSIGKMHTVQQMVETIAAVMETLNKRSEQISEITNVMSEMASQTSLLSLNASIEAARAGEHGAGFGVVAMEIKKLAEMSGRSSEQIHDLVRQVQFDISSASQSTEASIEEFAQGMQMIEQMGTAFERILESTREVVGQIQEASTAAEQMSAISEQVYASLQELDRIASKSSERSEAISSTTEEQIAVMEQVAASAHALYDMANALKELVQQFQINDEA